MASNRKLGSAKSYQILPDVVKTKQQSLVLVKKLLAIAVSNITYLRGLFPEKAYGCKYVGDLKVRLLRDQSPGAQEIVHWLEGCFDALERGYLKEIILSIFSDPESPQNITECYQFKVTYTEKGPQMDFESKNCQRTTMPYDDIHKSSTLLVRKLYTLMENLGPLPDNVCLNMKLFYYDQVTPQKYQPPGFKEDDSGTLVFERERVQLTMGQVDTPFHSLRMNVTTERNRVDSVDNDVAECVNNKWPLTFEDEMMSETPMQQEHKAKENVITDADIDFSESSQQAQTSYKNLQDSQTQRDNTRKTRSGRVFEPQISKLEFPLSQDPQPSAPKRRKFSVPK